MTGLRAWLSHPFSPWGMPSPEGLAGGEKGEESGGGEGPPSPCSPLRDLSWPQDAPQPTLGGLWAFTHSAAGPRVSTLPSPPAEVTFLAANFFSP